MTFICTPFVVASCIGFLLGIGFASFAYAASYIPAWTTIAVFVGGVTITVWRSGYRHRAVVCCGIVAVGFGVIRFTAITDAPAIATTIAGGERTVEGRVAAVTPLTHGRIRALLVDARTVASRRADPPGVRFRRPITMFLPAAGTGAVEYGDVVEVRCRLASPQRFGDRLTTDGVCSVRDRADIRLLATGGGSPTFRSLARVRRTLSAQINRTLSEPENGIVQSMVLGIPHAVNTDLEDAFRRSGTIHILVVSGWHMSYIADRIRRAFLFIGIPRGAALRTAIACVIAFTLLVGLTAPAVRGALVAVALAFVGLVGRVANPLRVLLLVATAMVAVHPHILGFDLAFQLTVAATAAIILGQPIAERLLPCRRPLLREFRDLITASVAASLATAPLLASAFGVVAILGPLVGVLVLPLAAAVIPTGAIFLAVSATLPLAAPPIAWALSAFSDAIVRSVEWIASLPWAQIPAPRFDGWFIAGVYLLAIAVVLQWYRHRGMPVLSPFARPVSEDQR